jgi:hypothetical protein
MKISQHSIVITVTIFSMKESGGYWRLYRDVIGDCGVNLRDHIKDIRKGIETGESEKR